jgi:hypothetical protein
MTSAWLIYSTIALSGFPAQQDTAMGKLIGKVG